MDQASRPSIAGIHHLKLACSNLQATHDFYTDVLGFSAVPQFTHRTKDNTVYAFNLRGPANIMVEVRINPTQAQAQKGWDPITWMVKTQSDLEDWLRYFDRKGVKHSRVLKGVQGWMLAAEDPDLKHVRLYTQETHEWDDDPDQDDYWLA